MIRHATYTGSRPARAGAYHTRPGGRPFRAPEVRYRGTVWRAPVRCAARVTGCLVLPLLAACAPGTSVQTADGMPLLDVRRGFCFVGCNVIARLPDGTKCKGFAPGMNYEHSLTADLYCPESPTALLQVEDVQRDRVSTGTLTPNASIFRDEPVDIDAIIQKHVPSSET